MASFIFLSFSDDFPMIFRWFSYDFLRIFLIFFMHFFIFSSFFLHFSSFFYHFSSFSYHFLHFLHFFVQVSGSGQRQGEAGAAASGWSQGNHAPEHRKGRGARRQDWEFARENWYEPPFFFLILLSSHFPARFYPVLPGSARFCPDLPPPLLIIFQIFFFFFFFFLGNSLEMTISRSWESSLLLLLRLLWIAMAVEEWWLLVNMRPPSCSYYSCWSMSLGCCVWVKIEELQSQANQFKKSTVKLRKAMWWKNMKLNILIGSICIIILILIIVSKWPESVSFSNSTLAWLLFQSS